MVGGDRVFIVAGVPVPMALRSNSDSSDKNLMAVGAVMVHGRMHAERFPDGGSSGTNQVFSFPFHESAFIFVMMAENLQFFRHV